DADIAGQNALLWASRTRRIGESARQDQRTVRARRIERKFDPVQAWPAVFGQAQEFDPGRSAGKARLSFVDRYRGHGYEGRADHGLDAGASAPWFGMLRQAVQPEGGGREPVKQDHADEARQGQGHGELDQGEARGGVLLAGPRLHGGGAPSRSVLSASC